MTGRIFSDEKLPGSGAREIWKLEAIPMSQIKIFDIWQYKYQYETQATMKTQQEERS